MDQFSLFATPLTVFDVPNTEELNVELTQRLVAESKESVGLKRSNFGGWHSQPNLAQRPEPCYQQLIQLIVDHVGISMEQLAASLNRPPPPPWRAAPDAWAMVMQDGDYTILHDHGGSLWSVSYYADAGDSDLEKYPEAGYLAIVDPRRSGRLLPGLDNSTFTVRPRTGRLVIFPGWLQHYVHPYRGTRPRVAISCNIRVEFAPEHPRSPNH